MIIGLIIAFTMLYNLIIGGVKRVSNISVISDIGAIIQIWLPFNLNNMFNWITNAASLVIIYYIYLFGINILNKVIGRN